MVSTFQHNDNCNILPEVFGQPSIPPCKTSVVAFCVAGCCLTEEQVCKVLMLVFQPLHCRLSFKSLTVALPVLHDALFECEEQVCKAFMPVFQLLHLQYLLPFQSLTMALPVLQGDVCECCAASALPSFFKVFKFNHGFTCVAGRHV